MTRERRCPPARAGAHEKRVERLRRELVRLGAATFLVTHPVNVRYLTGLDSSNAAVLVGRDRFVLLTDGRYVDVARTVGGAEVVEADRELPPWLGKRLGDLAEPLVAFESTHLTVAAHAALAEGGVELLPAAGVVEELRSIKDAAELDEIRRAAEVVTAVFEELASGTLVGWTESEVAWLIEQALHDAGADGPAFPPIVASGPNGALPHHHPGSRRIEAGETVIVDAGARIDGYCSDCTRTFATGDLPERLTLAYDLCQTAQQEALAGVRAGAAAREVDAIARSRIAGEGHSVLHGLGHGVGLEVHELPRLAETSEASLAPANVVTVEPGVYVPGSGGVRIEDLVVVTETGVEVLTPLAKDVVTVA